MSHAPETHHIPLPADTPGPHRRRLGLIAVVATFGGLLFGYDTGVVNGALDPMKQDLGLTAFTEGTVVSALVFGAALGAMVGGRLADIQGRRKNILMLAVIFMVGTLACVLSPTWQFLGVSRFVLGLAVGGASATVPVYLAEVAPVERRGSLVTRNELMIVSGQFAAFVINAIIFSLWGDQASIWRWMLLVAVAPAIALFIGMLRMPESPRWLSSQGRDEEALAVLKQIRSRERAEAEMAEVHFLADEEQQSQAGGWSDLAIPWVRRLVIVGALLGVCSQLSGINSIMYYGSQLLQEAGFSHQAAIIANTANGLVSVLGVSIGLMIVNKVNRRTMITGGFIATTTFHLLVGLTALLMPESTAKPYVILAFVVLFVFSMQLAIGPLTWLLLSEIFPLKIRSFAMGIAVFVLWIANATVALAFPPTVAALGISTTFFLFAAIGVGCIIFCWQMVPETRGRTLEQFEEEYRLAYGS